MGRHTKPSKAKTLLKRTGASAALAGAAVAGFGIVGAGTADAFPGQAGLVQCESSGNPTVVNNTAAGLAAGRPAGLFQIVTGTWLANGGGQFAPTADRATPAQQQIVADRIFASQGASPWECKTGPGPAAYAHFGGSTMAATESDSEPASSPAPATQAVNSGSTYTVVEGDTLSAIADKFNVPGGWAELQQLNSIDDANLILVGQQLNLK
ncbi:LysM peptidoglycan-binding domain-containing protein [Amycolatopsis taiwanensis]|uniref:Transglycosylase n=1 Tax=Amycolatopsis taiwanensis TaxID=342230 RepID=A0A9W6R610_9PSEU|nr:transglycosylase family protein [Amycolatopsis taiwanensis]GLY70084.1 transglycosylase [Amycolatopsis taiwanensis]